MADGQDQQKRRLKEVFIMMGVVLFLNGKVQIMIGNMQLGLASLVVGSAAVAVAIFMPGNMSDQASTSGEEQNVSEKGFIPAILLCMFLGELGAHRFYVGKVVTGILMLLTLGGLWVWLLIDVSRIATGKFTDKKGRPLRM